MSLFKVTGIQTVENKEVFAFAEKVLNTDKRISVHVDGSYISGTFRGKSNNEYEYCFTSKAFASESSAEEVECIFDEVEQLTRKVEIETVEIVVTDEVRTFIENNKIEKGENPLHFKLFVVQKVIEKFNLPLIEAANNVNKVLGKIVRSNPNFKS